MTDRFPINGSGLTGEVLQVLDPSGVSAVPADFDIGEVKQPQIIADSAFITPRIG